MFRVQTIYFYHTSKEYKNELTIYASLIEYVLFPTCVFALCFLTIHVN